MKETKQKRAFTRVAEAVGAYLENVGWRALVVGNPSIQQPDGSRAMNYEFVVRFTGGKKQPAKPGRATTKRQRRSHA